MEAKGKRILLVSPMPPAMGGISVSSARLRDNLVSDGFDVEIYDVNRCPRFIPHCLGKLATFVWLPFYVLLNRRFDIVHLHVSSYWRRVWLWLMQFCFIGVRTVVTVHGDINYYLRKPLSSKVMSFGDHIICVRQGDSKLLPENIRKKSSEIPAFILPADIDTLILPDAVDRFVSEAVTDGCPLIVFNGLLVFSHDYYDLYGFSDIVDLLDRADEDRLEYRAIIIVNNSIFDKVQSDFLAGLKMRLKGRDNIMLCVHTHFSLLPVFRLPGVIYVRPTKTDGDSLSVREALALGAKVVASDASVRPEGVMCYKLLDGNDFYDKLKMSLAVNKTYTMEPDPKVFYHRILGVYSSLLKDV